MMSVKHSLDKRNGCKHGCSSAYGNTCHNGDIKPIERRKQWLIKSHIHQNKRSTDASNHRYAKSALALILPIIYCLLDALGTFADSRVLETLDEDSANCAYELTFLLAAIVCFVYVVLIKKSKLLPKREAPKYAGALCETAGQFAYIYALADTEHVALAAPIISAYCVASVLWSRIFLKEKLSWKHYGMIALVVAGIVILGVYDA